MMANSRATLRLFILALCVFSALSKTILVRGPSASTSPQFEAASGSSLDTVISLLTVGDEVPRTTQPPATSYALDSKVDGIGSYLSPENSRYFVMIVNHEKGSGEGFVSRWIVDRATLEVVSGEDLLLSPSTQLDTHGTSLALNRLCASDLPPTSAFYNSLSGLGYADRIYTTGEEDSSTARALAYLLDGSEAPRTASVLPALGHFKVEMVAACPLEQDLTLVMITDDSNPGLIAAYLGQKQATGSPYERAGLFGGLLYAVRLDGHTSDVNLGAGSSLAFDLVPLGDGGDAEGFSYTDLRANATAASATFFSRPEDGGWRTAHTPPPFFFITTQPARLWRLDFSDLADPLLGGVATVLTDQEVFGARYDNLAFSADGSQLFMTEDGKAPNLLWRYDIDANTSSALGYHPKGRTDNEFSGIVAADAELGPGWYLFDNQGSPGGQLMAAHDSSVAPQASDLEVFGVTPTSFSVGSRTLKLLAFPSTIYVDTAAVGLEEIQWEITGPGSFTPVLFSTTTSVSNTVSFSLAGSYAVHVRISTAGGESAEDTFSVTVTASPSPSPSHASNGVLTSIPVWWCQLGVLFALVATLL